MDPPAALLPGAVVTRFLGMHYFCVIIHTYVTVYSLSSVFATSDLLYGPELLPKSATFFFSSFASSAYLWRLKSLTRLIEPLARQLKRWYAPLLFSSSF